MFIKGNCAICTKNVILKKWIKKKKLKNKNEKKVLIFDNAVTQKINAVTKKEDVVYHMVF